VSEDDEVKAVDRKRFDELRFSQVRASVLAFIKSYSVKVSLPGDEFKLASGGKSRLYVDAKRTCLHRSMHATVAHLLLEQVRAFGVVDALAGVVLGGCHLASVVAMAASLRGDLLYDVLQVRKGPKDHGTLHRVEAPWQPRYGQRAVLLEDVLSTGKTSAAACEALREGGYDVRGVVALIDRRLPEQRTDRLEWSPFMVRPKEGEHRESVPLRSVFKLEDLDLPPGVGGIT
jgi:orotate phosphoribosyltransferase